jgi:hypothetical protein
MNLSELKEMWEKDCIIDEDNLGHSAAITPNLHSKYINETMTIKLQLTKLQMDLAQMKVLKGRYFRGEMTSVELSEKGWEQWQYRTLKSDIVDMVEADSDVQKFIVREQYLKSVIYFLESVLSEIKARSFHIRSAIDYVKWRSGA